MSIKKSVIFFLFLSILLISGCYFAVPYEDLGLVEEYFDADELDRYYLRKVYGFNGNEYEINQPGYEYIRGRLISKVKERYHYFNANDVIDIKIYKVSGFYPYRDRFSYNDRFKAVGRVIRRYSSEY